MTHPVVFISYSHKDEKDKDRLLSHLGVLQHQGLIYLWSDNQIGPGTDWKQEINEAIAQARVAILLISAHFLTSNFILDEEIPRLLQRRRNEGLTIFPVIARPCPWKGVDWLAEMNVRPENGQSIWRTRGRRVDEDLAAIAEEVAAIVQKLERDRPLIITRKQLEISPEVKFVLGEMFPEYKKVVITNNFSTVSQSGSWIYQVQLLKEKDISELPLVAKIASASLIKREWESFKKIENQWPGVAELRGEPIFPTKSKLAGLCYPLMGGGVFEWKSMQAYYLEASLKEIVSLLETRLFKIMKERMLLLSRPSVEFSFRASYDRILPPNIVIEPGQPPAGTNPIVITPDKIPAYSVKLGDFVRIEGFRVTKVNLSLKTITLELPANLLPNAYYLKVQSANRDIDYHYGAVMPPVIGRVSETRQSLLNKEVKKILGEAFNPLNETILLDQTELPNPLRAITRILDKTQNVKINYIHGDLNLENILVDPEVGDIKLIDFAEAREDYVLHDFLRLETEVITKLLPGCLTEDKFEENIYAFYNQLHFETFETNWTRKHQPLSSTALEKPFAILALLRKVAQNGFYDKDDFSEYYQGLIIYLLSALKRKHLDDINGAKQLAFWGAATIQNLLQNPTSHNRLAPPRPSSKIHHNLPQPDYERFIGRQTEIEKIRQLLSPQHRSWVIIIDGIGGIGKSALALEIAHYYRDGHSLLSAEEQFEAIVWTSAKQTVLTSEGVVPRSQVLRTLDSICNTIAVTLQREDIIRDRSNNLIGLVRQLLTQRRTLLIVDNLETVDDEAVMSFLRELPAPTKAIVTTRHRIDVAYAIRLVHMPLEEVRQLIAQESEKRMITLSEDNIQRLYERTGGVPLAIIWSIAQMDWGGYDSETVLTRLNEPNSDIASFCFEETLQRVQGRPSFTLLMALSFFVTSASREALGHIAGLSEVDRDKGLAELEKLSLVNKFKNRFSLLPLTKSFIIAKLQEVPELENSIRTAFIDYFLKYSEKLTGAGWRSYQVLDEDMENFEFVMRLTYHLEMLELAEFVDNLGNFLHKRDKWNELIQYAEMVVDLGKKRGDKRVVMKQKLFALGWIRAIRLEEYQKALEANEEGKEIALELGDENGYATALRNQGVIYRKLGEYAKSKELLQHSLDIWRKLGNIRWEIKVLGSLGENEFKSGNSKSAQILYDDALQKAKEADEREQIALNLRRLSEVLLRMGSLEEALSKAEEALEMFNGMNIQSAVAQCQLILAEINQAMDKLDKAIVLAETAYEISSRLGLEFRREQAQKLLEILKRRKNIADSLT